MKKITITVEENGQKAGAVLNEEDVNDLKEKWGVDVIQLMYNVLKDEIKRNEQKNDTGKRIQGII
jgi:hypothetical protein